MSEFKVGIISADRPYALKSRAETARNEFLEEYEPRVVKYVLAEG